MVRHPFFLDKAVIPLKTNMIIPDDADVANAIGAITSHVVVYKKLAILHDGLGNYSIEGISGKRQFRSLDTADQFVRQRLTEIVHKQAMEAGTSTRTITFETKDHAPIIASGDPLFVKRTIFAHLKEGRTC